MSYRIVYDIKAIRFPHAVLDEALPDGKTLWDDQYLLIELGGDNNCWETGRHPRRSRSWDAVSYGCAWRTMQEVVHCSASCEGGCMKFYGRSHTSPECYIRHVRNVLKNPVDFGHPSLSSFNIAARLELTADSPYDTDIDELDAILGAKEKGGIKYWDIPFSNTLALAMLFKHWKGIDSRKAWHVFSVSGPTW